jgi:hypothetical protein
MTTAMVSAADRLIITDDAAFSLDINAFGVGR